MVVIVQDTFDCKYWQRLWFCNQPPTTRVFRTGTRGLWWQKTAPCRSPELLCRTMCFSPLGLRTKGFCELPQPYV